MVEPPSHADIALALTPGMLAFPRLSEPSALPIFSILSFPAGPSRRRMMIDGFYL